MNRFRTPSRPGRSDKRGQSLAIFAVSAVVLFGICGLAIDSGVSYLYANKVERAAAAGALAGVVYLPSQVATATSAAKAAVQRNGYVDNSLGANSVHVLVYRVPRGCDAPTSTTPCSPNRLGVGVATLVSNTFTRVLGFGPTHWVRQDATAEYLPALTLGQPGAEQGSTAAQLSSALCCYLLRTEGWATDRGEGDAYTPNRADPSNPALASATDVHALSGTLGTDFTTIPGFNTLPAQGGYNFQIVVPTGTSNANLLVYNPAFSPNQSQDYHEADSITATNHAQYSVMEYTLFQVNDPFNHLRDTPLAQMKVSPIDAATNPVNFMNGINNGSGGGTLSAGAQTGIYHNWVDIFNPPASVNTPDSKGQYLINKVGGSLIPQLTAGTTYRLRVDTLDDVGNNPGPGSPTQSKAHKGYALETALNSNASSPCNTCSLGALNDFAVYTPLAVPNGQTSATFDIPLVNIPPQYAGLTIDFYVFDPGDLFGDTSNLLSVVNPDTNSPATPSPVQTHVPIFNLGPSRDTPPVPLGLPGANEITNSNLPAQRPDSNATIQTLWGCGNNDCYNGNWLLYKVTIPNNYTGTVNGQFWKLRYSVQGTGTANDTFTMVVSFDGPPVHLIPNP